MPPPLSGSFVWASTGATTKSKPAANTNPRKVNI
jgi:hypothetical protein